MSDNDRPGYVNTVYGPMPGCPDCGVIPLRGVHICEHGVTALPPVVAEFTFTFTRTSGWPPKEDPK